MKIKTIVTKRNRKDIRKDIEAKLEKLLHKHQNIQKHTQNKVIEMKTM